MATATNLLFAFSAAVLIWAGVGARLNSQRVVVLSIGLAVTEGVECQLDDPAQRVEVTLEGPRELMNSLASERSMEGFRVLVRPDVSALALGRRSLAGLPVRIDPLRDLVVPPRFASRVRARSVEPAVVSLSVSSVYRRGDADALSFSTACDLEALTGKPEDRGDVFSPPTIDVSRVQIFGSVQRIEAFRADPQNRGPDGQVVVRPVVINVDGAVASLERRVRFALPPGLEAEPSTALMTVPLVRRGSLIQRRSFRLAVRFIVPPGLSRRVRPVTRDKVREVDLELRGSGEHLDAFERRLADPDPTRRPFAAVRVRADDMEGQAREPIHIGNFDPRLLVITGRIQYLVFELNPEPAPTERR